MIEFFRAARAVAPAGLMAALLSVSAGISYADPEGAAPPPQSQPEAVEVSDEQLRQFVDAATEVQSVQEEYAAEIQSTQEADEAQSLRQEAQEKMVEAVEGAGLSVSEYNLIAQRLQEDPSLANRLNDIQSD
jgi:hypothetical protein